jgi:hypothetical protein
MNQEQYKYYSTQRPIDLGTFPKPADNPPLTFINYDERIPVEHGAFLAWGELIYANPLTARQASDYELRPAPDNPDIRRTMNEQAQTVGKYEEQKRVPDTKRLIWWYSDFGSYVPKDFVTPEQLATRYQQVKELSARSVKKKKPHHYESR